MILVLILMWISGFIAGALALNYFVAIPYYKRLKLIHTHCSKYYNDTHHILIKKLTGL